jgi:hypothetical protein
MYKWDAQSLWNERKNIHLHLICTYFPPHFQDLPPTHSRVEYIRPAVLATCKSVWLQLSRRLSASKSSSFQCCNSSVEFILAFQFHFDLNWDLLSPVTVTCVQTLNSQVFEFKPSTKNWVHYSSFSSQAPDFTRWEVFRVLFTYSGAVSR